MSTQSKHIPTANEFGGKNHQNRAQRVTNLCWTKGNKLTGKNKCNNNNNNNNNNKCIYDADPSPHPCY